MSKELVSKIITNNSKAVNLTEPIEPQHKGATNDKEIAVSSSYQVVDETVVVV